MKPQMVMFFTKLILVLTLVPNLVFGANVSTGRIRNYGSYQQVDPSLHGLLKPLFGHVPSDVNTAQQIAPMDGGKTLQLSIVLPLNNEEELEQTLIELTNPHSHNYQNFLSQAEFIARYSPTEEQVDSVISHLTNRGMNIESVDDNRLIIHINGSIDSINNLFHTEIYHFVDQTGKEFYAPLYELQVDRILNIVGVQGLDDRIHARPKFKAEQNLKIQSDALISGLTPSNITTAYSLSSGLTGAGQTLALFELDGFTASDITAYENAFNLPHVPLQTILVDGVTGAPGDGAPEVTLDIELMIAVAPGASKILVYEGPNSGKGLLDTYNRIATDNLAKSVSTSWGLSENSSTSSLLQSESLIFKQMVAQGQILYAASGDSGAYDDGSTLSVDDPASQPWVVAVGGTTLFTNSNGSYNRETTWSSGNGPGNSGGGGGISSVWSIPSWQQGVISPSSRGSTTMRNVPDVSLDADPRTGYAIYFGGRWTVYGGTSCAAPLWAAFTALVNQQRANNQEAPLGFPNPIIYQLGQTGAYASTFHDINDGSTNGYYPAVTGYDLATGWGTFKGDALIASLANTVPPPPPPPPPTCTHVNPSIAITPNSAQSVAGGTVSYTVTLTNNDQSSCGSSTFNLSTILTSSFTYAFGQNQLNVGPGQAASTTLAVTSASNTPPATYVFPIRGTNSAASSIVGSASATYIVTTNPGSNVNLTITPQNATFSYNSNTYAFFTVTLKDGNVGVPNQLTNLVIQGPVSWQTYAKTGSSGSYRFGLFLNSSVPKGTYHVTITSQYNNATVVGTDTFYVR